MEIRRLGRTGLKVSKLCLGAMTFGNKDWGCDEKTSHQIVKAFLDAGGNFIDTADGYAAGVSEEITGRAIAKQRQSDPFFHILRPNLTPDSAKQGGLRGQNRGLEGQNRPKVRIFQFGPKSVPGGWKPIFRPPGGQVSPPAPPT